MARLRAPKPALEVWVLDAGASMYRIGEFDTEAEAVEVGRQEIRPVIWCRPTLEVA